MKKSAFLVIILIVAVAILATICLFNQEAMSNSVKLSVYTYAQSNQTIKPELTLKENKQFDFFYAVESSYKADGTYEIKNKRLYLETSDKEYVFVFSIKNETLAFDFGESILPPGFTNANSVFILCLFTFKGHNNFR